MSSTRVPLLIVDAGHGGLRADGTYTTAPSKMFTHSEGVFHRGGTFFEGVFNRKLANVLIGLCKQANIETAKVYDEVEDTTLGLRVQRANALAVNRQAVYMSLHGNAFSNTNARGISVHIAHQASAQSQRLATLLAQELQKISETPFRRHNQQELFWRDNFFVLTRTNMPAVLSENGFFTNLQDANLMITDEFIARVAYAHFLAFIKFFQT
jgi:N-acetylmuramoyl-L-alanine amidase